MANETTLNFTRKERHTHIVAFDPDVNLSGVAIIDLKTKELILDNWSFPHIVDQLQAMAGKVSSQFYPKIIVEGSWLRQSRNGNSHNWHTKEGDSVAVSVAKGQSQARNQETGRRIVEMAQHYGLQAEAILPLTLTWGKDGHSKISHKEFTYFTGYTKKTNQDARDAGLIAWIYAGYPVRVDTTNGRP